jgi:Zn-dependent membrane protease YugP
VKYNAFFREESAMHPIFIITILPALLLSLIATFMVQATFRKYSKVRSASGISGAEAAGILLRSAGITDVKIEPVRGLLTDHYDPVSKTLRLSENVYGSPSIASIGVACHEAGHAIQHATGYAWLGFRTTLVPLTQFGTYLSYFMFVLGMALGFLKLAILGVALFSVAVVFSIVTLPVEWDASRRARELMVSSGIVTWEEEAHAGKVLNAAFLTYVAAAVTALMQLLYWLAQLGLFGRRD